MKYILILQFIFLIQLNVLAEDGTASNTLESNDNKIIINNIPLSYNIKILESNSRFMYDLLDARVTIKNKDQNMHYVEYKFTWFDVNGFIMAKNQSKWKTVSIDAKDTIVLRDLAISSKIDSFKFYIRGIE